jgi:hypothetical protein
MALAISMMMLTLLTALAGALVLGTVTETAIAASYREGVETFYAAEAAVEFVIDELDAAGNWQEIVDDGSVSDFADGPPAGTRQVGSITIDLAAAAGDIVTAARDSNYDVVYQLFAYGRLADLIPAVAARSPYYLVVCIGGLDTDETEELSMMRVVGRAYGPTGSRRSVIVTVSRPSGSEEPLRVVSWHELR